MSDFPPSVKKQSDRELEADSHPNPIKQKNLEAMECVFKLLLCCNLSVPKRYNIDTTGTLSVLFEAHS